MAIGDPCACQTCAGFGGCPNEATADDDLCDACRVVFGPEFIAREGRP